MTTEIAQIIREAGGRVPFARFMELALTHPREGYYARAQHILGQRGDFSTAPLLSPEFNEAIVVLVDELVQASLQAQVESEEGGVCNNKQEFWDSKKNCGDKEICKSEKNETCSDVVLEAERLAVVELGGGEGHLAMALLNYWQNNHADLQSKISYCLVEVGEGLCLKQREMLDSFIINGWDVRWGDTIAQVCEGTSPVVILGNEFLDALPVHVVEVSEATAREAWVVLEEESSNFVWQWGEITPSASVEMLSLWGTEDTKQLKTLSKDGILELRPAVVDLLGEIDRLMPSGSLLFIDYGDWGPGQGRSVRGYFHHQLIDDPLARPGQQDLTADVNFAALDEHGRALGFEAVFFTSLSMFLAAALENPQCNLPLVLSDYSSDFLEADKRETVLQALLDEKNIGGVFKVILQVR